MDLSLYLPLVLFFLKVSVHVNGLSPTIDVKVKNVTAVEGEKAILVCSVNNLGEYKVAWLDQSSALITVGENRITEDERFNVEQPTAGAWNLHINDVVFTDQGKYLCRVNTEPVTSKTVNLEVLVPAKIRHELSSGDKVLTEGDTLVLVCNATGVPRPFVTWYKLVSGRKEKITGSREVLIISNVSRDDGGTYQCVAYNGASASKKINVSIKLRAPVPVIDAQVANVSVLEGETATLPCSIENLGEYKVAWIDQYSALLTVNDNRITDDVRFQIEHPEAEDNIEHPEHEDSEEHPEAEEWNLQIQSVDLMDQGQYLCRVNTQPITSKTVHLEVIVPAKIMDKLSSEDTIIQEGQTLSLVCNVTGVPKPVVTWYKLVAGSKLKLNSSEEVLLIPNVSKKDSGIYECMAFNGVTASKQISVSIEYGPKVTVLSKRVGQFKGRDTILDCKIVAKPAPDIYWLKDNNDVATFDREKYQVELYSDAKDTTINTLSLRIVRLQKEDFGEYTCYARNKIGKAKDSVTVYDYSVHFTTTVYLNTTATQFESVNITLDSALTENVSQTRSYGEPVAESNATSYVRYASYYSALLYAISIVVLFKIVERFTCI